LYAKCKASVYAVIDHDTENRENTIENPEIEDKNLLN
jgi:hypothetical protein